METSQTFKPGVAYMEVPRCDRCRFWVDPPDDWSHRAAYVQALRPGSVGRRCARVETEDGSPLKNGTLAFAVDSEEYAAWLETMPGFGCVQFEEKK